MDYDDRPSEILRLDPRSLLRSFLVILLGYASVVVAYFSVFMLLMWTFFPEMAAAFDQDPEAFDEMRQQDPRELVSHQFGALLLIVLLPILAAIGFIVAWSAPFGRFGHGVFLAVIVFATFVQAVIAEASPLPQWTAIGLLAGSPPAVLIGAWTCACLLPIDGTAPPDEQPSDFE